MMQDFPNLLYLLIIRNPFDNFCSLTKSIGFQKLNTIFVFNFLTIRLYYAIQAKNLLKDSLKIAKTAGIPNFRAVFKTLF